jgi:hypothetical protein
MCVAQTLEGRYRMDAGNYNLRIFTVRRLVLLTMRLAEHIASMKDMKNE